MAKLCHQKLDKKSIMMYKTFHGVTPKYLRSCFVFRNYINTCHLRNTENALALPQPSTDYIKINFSTVELSCETVYH